LPAQGPIPVSVGDRHQQLHLGNEKHICFFVRDITRRKQDEELLRQTRDQLARAERLEMAGSLAGHIAHDFNNLLTLWWPTPGSFGPNCRKIRRRMRISTSSPRRPSRWLISTNSSWRCRAAPITEQSVLNINAVIETEALFLARDETAKGIKLDLSLAGICLT